MNIDYVNSLLEYVVMYTTDRWKLQKQWQQKAAVSQNVKQQTFHGLRPETTYYFFVQAMTDLGFGPRSKVVSYTTPKGMSTITMKSNKNEDETTSIFILKKPALKH